MGFRLAWRNLWRNRWRSGLTLAGIVVATVLTMWTQSLMGAMMGQMVSGMTEIQFGDLQMHSASYIEERSLYHGFEADAVLLGSLDAVADVDGVAPRVMAFGLLGHERSSVVAALTGVDPTRESTVTVVHKRLVSGRWLSQKVPKRLSQAEVRAGEKSPREVLIGATLAKQLKVKVGDSLVVFASAAGGFMGDDALIVVGIFKTGNADLDRMGAMMHIEDVQWLTALEGKVHEIAVSAERGADLDKVAASLGSALPKRDDPLVARTWMKILPDLAQLVDMSGAGMWVMSFIIFLLVGLGILNTQRMSALERRREFGVLMAIGTTPGRMRAMVMAETLTLTSVGALIGAVVGTIVVYYFSVAGFDMGASFNYSGVQMDSIFYFVLTPDVVIGPLVVVSIIGLLCGLWPAMSSARLNIVSAIAGRS